MKPNRFRVPRSWLAAVLGFSLLIPQSTVLVDATESTDKIQEAMDLLERYHYRGASGEAYIDGAIRGMIEALGDPYTTYYTKNEVDELFHALDMQYVGIGIRLADDQGTLRIIEVFPGSPAAEAGLQVGDAFTSVDGANVSHWTVEQLIQRVTGPAGSKVKLEIARDGKTLRFEVERKSIKLPSVKSDRFKNGTGYIRLYGFTTDADELFIQALGKLKQQSLKSLVIDLRGNPGGYVDTAANIAKQFIEKGVLIHTDNKQRLDQPVYLAKGSTVDFPVYVLVDEYSASASEVLAGALQDYKKAKIVGNQTFGKGSVQSFYYLSDGSMIKITIEEYLTPLGRKVDQVGITPDVKEADKVGQVLQTIKLAGVSMASILLNNTTLTVDGMVLEAGTNTVLTSNKKTYIASHAIAQVLNGALSWRQANERLMLKQGKLGYIFDRQSGTLIVEENTSYFELSSLQKRFPKLKVDRIGNGYQISLKP